MNYQELINLLEKNFTEHNLEAYVSKIIISYVLDCPISSLIKYYKDEVNNKNLKLINKYAKKYLKGKPIQYVINETYFYGLKLYVNKNVLIPRNETEELVDWVIKDNYQNESILDLCCGSGCISLALKNKLPTCSILGSDISNKALKVAKKNAKQLNLNVKYLHSDLLTYIIKNNIHVDVIVANPPYISVDDVDIDENVLRNEPKIALFSPSKDGLSYYRAIIDQLNKISFKALYFEFGYKQKEELEKLLKKYPYHYEFRKDINNNDRMVKIWR